LLRKPRFTGSFTEEHQYGLYTDLAKKAHENPEEFEKYRQSGIGGWESYIKNQKAGH